MSRTVVRLVVTAALATAALLAPVTSAQAASLTITTTALPGGELSVAYLASLDAAGGTAPRTWSVTSGSLPAGISLSASGVLSGTPTTSSSSTFTVRVADAASHTASASFTVPVTARTNYAQPGFTTGHTGYESTETSIGRTAIGSLHVDWSLPEAAGTVAVVAGVLYAITPVPDSADGNEQQLAAYQLLNGKVLWRVPSSCGGSDVALTASAVLVQCSDGLRAFSLTGTHAQLWNTAVTDPSASPTGFAVLADRVVVDGYSQVTAYRLTDGVRLWRQVVNTDNGGGQGVASGSNVAVVPIGDRLRAFDTTNGAIKWTVMQPAGSAVVAGSVVYATLSGQVYALNLTTGSTVWHVTPDFYAARVLAVDGSYVYVDVEEDDGFSIEYHLTSYVKTSGAPGWVTDVPRPAGIALSNGLLYLGWTTGGNEGTEGGTYVLAAGSGKLLRSFDEAGRYTGEPVVVGGRYVATHTDGVEVYGFAPPLPTVAPTVLRTAWVGAAYSQPLVATGGTAPLTWSLAGGTLPAGLTLGSDGLIKGTPTAAGTVQVTTRVTDARGQVAKGTVTVSVRAAAAGTWPTIGADNARSGLAAGESAVGLDTYQQLSQQWTTDPIGGDSAQVYGDVAVVGGRAYVSASGTHNDNSVIKVYAFSTTGTATGVRAPVWAARTDDYSGNGSGVTVSGNTAFVIASDGLYAFNATTGSRRWKAPLESQDPPYAPLVLGGTVFVGTSDGSGYVAAFNATTGAPTWSSDFRPRLEDTAYDPTIHGALSTDGTRVFVVGGCTVSAIDPSNGSLKWDRVLSPNAASADCAQTPSFATPLVSAGVVYATSTSVVVALDAASGAVLWQRNTGAAGVMAVSNGVLVYACFDGNGFDTVLCGADTTSGLALWAQTSIGTAYTPRVSIADDLVLAPTTDDLLSGFDLRTGELVYQSDPPASGYLLSSQAAVVDGRVYFLAGDQQLHAYALP